jgi:hypothetical protein
MGNFEVSTTEARSDVDETTIIDEMRNVIALVLVVVGVFLQGADACVSGSCQSGMCSDIPANNQV